MFTPVIAYVRCFFFFKLIIVCIYYNLFIYSLVNTWVASTFLDFVNNVALKCVRKLALV